MNTSPHGKWGRGIYTGDPPRMSVCITEQETYQNRLWHVLQRTVVEGWKADNTNSLSRMTRQSSRSCFPCKDSSTEFPVHSLRYYWFSWNNAAFKHWLITYLYYNGETNIEFTHWFNLVKSQRILILRT